MLSQKREIEHRHSVVRSYTLMELCVLDGILWGLAESILFFYVRPPKEFLVKSD